LKPLLTVHIRVRNEERFVRQAIESVLPAADKILIFDTGSTDRTVERILEIKDPRVQIVHKPATDAAGLVRYRNEMADLVKTEWFWIVDGDEVYPKGAALLVREFLLTVPGHVHRIAVRRKHFYGSFNLIGKFDAGGRIYRTSRIRTRIFKPKYGDRVGHETPYDIADPDAVRQVFSITVPEEIWFFHLHYMPRSSKDSELGRMRGWRDPPFPLRIYLGPWPAGLADPAPEKKLTSRLCLQWVLANLQSGGKRLSHFAMKAVSKLSSRR
jgi:glycosyltransferase involved in cell wall biosynthesis